MRLRLLLLDALILSMAACSASPVVHPGDGAADMSAYEYTADSAALGDVAPDRVNDASGEPPDGRASPDGAVEEIGLSDASDAAQGKEMADADGDHSGEVVEPAKGWEGTYTTPYMVSITGNSTGQIKSIAINGNKGSIVVGGELTKVIVTEKIEWDTPQTHYTLYQMLGPSDDDLVVVYAYCEGDALTYIYAESFTLPMTGMPATGTCELLTGSHETKGVLNPMKELGSPPAQLAGVKLTGEKVSAVAGKGWAKLDKQYDITLFGFVDCMKCPSADGRGWYEFHAVLHNQFPKEVCFGIFYAFPSDNQGTFSWGFCMTDFRHIPAQPLGTVQHLLNQ